MLTPSEIRDYKPWENLIFHLSIYINNCDGGPLGTNPPDPWDVQPRMHLKNWLWNIKKDYSASSIHEIWQFIKNPRCEVIAIALFDALGLGMQDGFVRYCKTKVDAKKFEELCTKQFDMNPANHVAYKIDHMPFYTVEDVKVKI